MDKLYKPLHCLNCFKPIYIQDVVNGRLTNIPTKDYSEIQFKLEDGSFARVPVCQKCNDKYDDSFLEVWSARLGEHLPAVKKLKSKTRRMRDMDAIKFYASALHEKNFKKGKDDVPE